MEGSADLETIVGVFAGSYSSFVAIAQLFQTAKLLRAKDSQALSLIWLSLYSCGGAIWTYYGILITSYPLIISSAISCLIALINISLSLHYRKKRNSS